MPAGSRFQGVPRGKPWKTHRKPMENPWTGKPIENYGKLK